MSHHEHPGLLRYVGYMVTPRQIRCRLYSIVTLDVPGESENRPLMHDGRIILIKDPSLSHKVVEFADETIKSLWPPDPAFTVIHDLPKVLYLIERGSFDDSARILDCINDVEDLIISLGKYYPQQYKDAIVKFTSHLIFNKEYGSFLQESGISRPLLKECLIWMLREVRKAYTYLSLSGWDKEDPWKPLF